MGISVWTTCPESLCAPTGSRTFHLLIAITTTKQSLYGIKSYTQNAIPDSQQTVSIALNGTQNNSSNYTENLLSTGPPPVLIHHATPEKRDTTPFMRAFCSDVSSLLKDKSLTSMIIEDRRHNLGLELEDLAHWPCPCPWQWSKVLALALPNYCRYLW